MPSYRVTDPKTGRSLKLTGNQPPSSQTIQKAFGASSKPPEYSLRGFGENVASSTGKLAGETASAVVNVFNPDREKNTISNLGKLGAGFVQKLDPTEGNKIANPLINTAKFLAIPTTVLQDRGQVQNNEAVAESVGSFYKDRYGGGENIKKTLYEDPVGALADISTVASAGAGLVKGGATVAGKAGVASKAAKIGKIADKLDPVVAATSGVGKVSKPIFSRVGKGAIEATENLPLAGVGSPKQTGKALKVSGKSASKLFDEYGLWDKSPETVRSAIDKVSQRRSEIAGTSKVSKSEVLNALDKQIQTFTAQAQKGSDSAISVVEQLERQKQLLNSRGEDLLVSDLQDIVRVIDTDIPNNSFFSEVAEVTNPSIKGKRIARKTFVEEMGKVSPEFKQLGRDESALISLGKAFESAQARGISRQTIGLPDIGALTAGGVVGGIPGAIAGYAGRQFLASPTGQRFITKGAQKAVGFSRKKLPQGFKTFSRTLYDTGRFGRMGSDK